MFPFLISPFPHFSFPHYLFLFLGQPGVNICVYNSQLTFTYWVDLKRANSNWAKTLSNIQAKTYLQWPDLLFPQGSYARKARGSTLVSYPGLPTPAVQKKHATPLHIHPTFRYVIGFTRPPTTSVHNCPQYILIATICYPWFVDKTNTQANGTTNTAIFLTINVVLELKLAKKLLECSS